METIYSIHSSLRFFSTQRYIAFQRYLVLTEQSFSKNWSNLTKSDFKELIFLFWYSLSVSHVSIIFLDFPRQSLKKLNSSFKVVKHVKPDASRKESVESYVLGMGFKG